MQVQRDVASNLATIKSPWRLHEARGVEMHRRSKRRQIVSIPTAAVVVEFQPDETIWTESSHKYSASEVFQIARDAGFQCKVQSIDQQWPFAESLLIAD